MSDKLPYTAAIVELEEIVSSIENEEINVDELSIKVKRASELIKFCKEKLKNTEEEVSAILKEMND